MSRAVLLLHGFVTDRRDFGDLTRKLDGIYDEVVVGSYPGHGIPPKYEFDVKKFKVDETFEMVEKTFDDLRNRHKIVDVIGFSMGGALATYLTQVREVNDLILLAPANKYINTRHGFSTAKLRFARFRNAIEEALKSKNPADAYKKNFYDIEKNNFISFDMAIKTLIPRYTYSTISVFMKIIKRCNESLKEINNRTLICWGEIDQLVPVESAEHILSLCKNDNGQLVKFDDITHLMLQSNNANKIEDVVLEFIKNGRKSS